LKGAIMSTDPHDVPRLVDIGTATIVQSKGLAIAEVIAGDLHMTFCHQRRDGVGQGRAARASR